MIIMSYITLIIIILLIAFLFIINWFRSTPSKKIVTVLRKFWILIFGILALLMAFGGRYIFSLPFLMMILPLIKTKAGLTLFQIFRIWNLLQILKRSGRFNFNSSNNSSNIERMSKAEALKILNLNPNKTYTKKDIINAYKKIMKKVHPDVSPELTRLASIVNEAKEVLTKNIS
tara:strand:+ start:838 stop:1359 length:522 start_codon:yes stop_codon:yes gene_type:complete